MRSIEGKRGMPRPRPPFPALKGLWEKPTILNNVETLASIARSFSTRQVVCQRRDRRQQRHQGFRSFRRCEQYRLVEVPMGTVLRKLIFDIGAHSEQEKVQGRPVGRPSGGCVPEQYLDIPVDYEEIAKVGAIMGSGGAIVMDMKPAWWTWRGFSWTLCRTNPAANARPAARARGACFRFWRSSARVAASPATSKPSKSSPASSGCLSLRPGADRPEPVLSTLRYFRDEYEAHIHEKRCPAKRCVALLKFEIEPEICTKCGLCFEPVRRGDRMEEKGVARIDREKCIKCMTCFDNASLEPIF